MKVRISEFARCTRSTDRQKASVVRRARTESGSDYPVAGDYYKRVREGLQRLRKVDGDTSTLDRIPDSVHVSRRAHVRRVVESFKSWASGRSLSYFAPPRGKWQHEGVQVPVNPELAVVVDGTPHILKVNFNRAPIHPHDARVVAHMLHRVHASTAPKGCVMGVLDLATGKTYCLKNPSRSLDGLLETTADEITSLWKDLDARVTD